MSEEDDLVVLADLTQDRQRLPGASVVEPYEDVVHEQREWLRVPGELLDGGQAQGQEELLAAGLDVVVICTPDHLHTA